MLLFLLLTLLIMFLRSNVGFDIWNGIKSLFLAPLNWFSWNKQKTEKPCEIIKYVKETDKDLEEFKKV